MKNAEKYFKKNGCIFGVSEKFQFDCWQGYVVVFDDFEKAVKWLHTEEGDFRQRELIARTNAKECLSRGYVLCPFFNKEGEPPRTDRFLDAFGVETAKYREIFG